MTNSKSNSKSTKRALVSSALAILMCMAMLIGTTFAWFTDTASTAVNKIQSGRLDVALEMKNAQGKWVNAEGKTLDFKKAASAPEDGAILWEPGCTYELPELRVVNNGNLALKYKVQITGIQGSTKLNEVIDWTINNAPIDLTEKHLAAGEKPETGFVIKGHMKEEAGNEYQNLTIDGIGITVYATQDTVESDSYDNQYDKEATYPIEILPGISDAPLAPKTDAEGNVSAYYYENSDKTVTATVPAAAVTEGNTPVITVTPDGKGVTATAEGKEKLGYDIKIENAAVSADAPAEVTLKLGIGLQNVTMKHNGEAMTAAADLASMTVDSYYYDAVSGIVTLKVSHFSPFAAEFDPPMASLNGKVYYSLHEAIRNAAATDTVVLTRDLKVTEKIDIAEDTSLTLDLSGNTLELISTNDDGILVNSGATLTLADSKHTGKYLFDCNASGADGIFICNQKDGKTATLNIEGNVEISVAAKANTAIHAYAEKGNAVVNIKDARINVTGEKATKAVVVDQNSTLNMNGGEFMLNCDFESYRDSNDVVGILVWGQNGKQENIAVNVNGGIIKIGGKNAFAQGIQIGMKNGYSENVQVNMNDGIIELAQTENGKGYAFTTYKDIYGTFTMTGGTVTGNVDELALAYIGKTNLTVTGGTFSIDPTGYVAEGFKATNANGIWTVQ